MDGPGTFTIAGAIRTIPEEYRREGTHVLFYDEEAAIECECVLRRWDDDDFWLADVVDGTCRSLKIREMPTPEDEFPNPEDYAIVPSRLKTELEKLASWFGQDWKLIYPNFYQ